MMIALLIFVVGIMNIASSLGRGVPARLLFLESVIPVEVSNLSRTLTLVIGFLLLFLAYGLKGRRVRAWKISLVLLLTSFILHLVKGLDYEETLVIGGSLVVLVLTKNQFRVSSSRSTWLKSVARSLIILAGLFVYATFGYFLFDKQFSKEISLMNIQKDYWFSIFGVGHDTLVPLTARARWFQDSISVVGWTSLLMVLVSLFAPIIPDNALDEGQKRWLYTLVKKYGKSFLAYFSLMEDKQIFFPKGASAALAYKMSGSMAVVLGPPLGPVDYWAEAVSQFRSFCDHSGLSVVFYCLSRSEKEWLVDNSKGWSSFEIGEWAVIDLDKFDLNKTSLVDVRHGVSRFDREGLEIEIFKLPQVPWSVLKEIMTLRNEWLKEKRISRIGFSNDFFPLPVENDGYLAVARSSGEIVAGLSLFPTSDKSLVLDMMIRKKNLNNGIMEGFIAKTILGFRSRGFRTICLGLAVQAGGILGSVAKRFERLYKFRSLRSFKSKFDPSWQKAYVVYRNKAKLPQVLLALVRVHLAG